MMMRAKIVLAGGCQSELVDAPIHYGDAMEGERDREKRGEAESNAHDGNLSSWLAGMK